MAQFRERLRLDLADAFASHAELLADLFERADLAVVETEAKPHDGAFAVVQFLQRFFDRLAQQRARGRGRGRDHVRVLDEVTEEAVVFFAHRRFERHRLLRDALDLANLVGRHLDLRRDLFDRRFASELLQHLPRDAQHLVHRLDHVHRDADGARLVGDRARDGLTDPPRRVRRELEALRVVELLDRTDETEVAFLNEIEERHAPADVTLRDRDDEPQVRLGELTPGELAVALHGEQACPLTPADLDRFAVGVDARELLPRVQTRLDALRKRDFLLGGEQRDLADLLEVHPDGVEAPALGMGRTGGGAHGRELRIGLVVGDRTRAGTRTGRRARPVLRAPRGGRARRRGRALYAAAFVLELQLLRDLVEHLDAARLEHLPQLAQLVGVGLEIGERGEDLAGRDEAALAHLREHVVDR